MPFPKTIYSRAPNSRFETPNFEVLIPFSKLLLTSKSFSLPEVHLDLKSWLPLWDALVPEVLVLSSKCFLRSWFPPSDVLCLRGLDLSSRDLSLPDPISLLEAPFPSSLDSLLEANAGPTHLVLSPESSFKSYFWLALLDRKQGTFFLGGLLPEPWSFGMILG